MRRPIALIAILLAAVLVIHGASARAEGWHSAQPLPPPPGEGLSGVGAPVSLGQIGDIEFWAPNRGLLITAGNGAVPAGLYYYNGLSWRELSEVCGGPEGRIAWAGENDFWTIAEQQTGQQTENGSSGSGGRDLSLCHFYDGRVVASYAEPIGVAASYQRMYAAACSGPNDCWFGGEQLPGGLNSGAFHLHWNGVTMTPVPSLEDPQPQLQDPPHTVRGIVSYKGRFYESVQLEQIAAGESASQPYLIHRIVEGSSNPFVGMTISGPAGNPFTYGGVEPTQLSAPMFATDSEDLWATAGAADSTSDAVPVVLTLDSEGQFQQVELSDPDEALGAGDAVGGMAAEPGTNDAWISVDPPREASSSALAHVLRVRTSGEVEPSDRLPEAGEAVGHKGAAGPIACPAKGDCWVATADGWLFHLGGSYPEDHDPYLQELITYRPPDASIPFVAPEIYPEDDSGANPSSIPPPPAAPSPPAVEGKVRAALFSHVKDKLVGRTTLALTFTLATKSHVKLIALRKKRKVAATSRIVLSHGRHTLTLHLDARAWPTKLDLQVQAIGTVPLVSSSSKETESTGGATVVTTSLHVFDRQLSPLTILP
jgi:hypothetical protein